MFIQQLHIGCPKKSYSIKVKEKVHQKKEDDLAESWKFGTWVTALWYLFLQNNIFLFFIDIADMAIQMSNFDNFDVDQMSSKFAQT